MALAICQHVNYHATQVPRAVHIKQLQTALTEYYDDYVHLKCVRFDRSLQVYILFRDKRMRRYLSGAPFRIAQQQYIKSIDLSRIFSPFFVVEGIVCVDEEDDDNYDDDDDCVTRTFHSVECACYELVHHHRRRLYAQTHTHTQTELWSFVLPAIQCEQNAFRI